MKLTDKQLVELEKFHKDVASKCGPIIDELAYKHFPELTPEDLGTLVLDDRMVGSLFTLFALQNTLRDDVGKTLNHTDE